MDKKQESLTFEQKIACIFVDISLPLCFATLGGRILGDVAYALNDPMTKETASFIAGGTLLGAGIIAFTAFNPKKFEAAPGQLSYAETLIRLSVAAGIALGVTGSIRTEFDLNARNEKAESSFMKAPLPTAGYIDRTGNTVRVNHPLPAQK